MDFDVDQIEVRKLTQEDLPVFKSLIHLFNIVFEEDESAVGSETKLFELLSNNSFVAMAAFHDNEIVGGLTAYELPLYYSDNFEIFLYDLAVKPEYQRMGIGKSLIRNLREYCLQNGINEFFVLAHEEDAHALDFYRSTGGKSEKVVNFLYAIKIGKE
jgi:aminoglycoside 3-N-acetyltransferase I